MDERKYSILLAQSARVLDAYRKMREPMFELAGARKKKPLAAKVQQAMGEALTCFLVAKNDFAEIIEGRRRGVAFPLEERARRLFESTRAVSQAIRNLEVVTKKAYPITSRKIQEVAEILEHVLIELRKSAQSH